MKQLAFCEYCMDESEYEIRIVDTISILNNEDIQYKYKKAICNICGNEIFVSGICDFNLDNLYNEYRKKHSIITIKEIRRILLMYSIEEEALSLLLGFNSNAIRRYLDGDMTLYSHSDILKKIYESPNYYSIVLQNNKEKIDPINYSKSRQAVKRIMNREWPEEKIDAVIKYLIVRGEDLTPLMLQHLLYYVQGIYYIFANKFIFNEKCEVNINGPIFKSVFERYEMLGYDEINKEILADEKLKLEDIERNVVECVIKFFGCYSGKVLKQMTRNEAPWILTMANDKTKFEFESDQANKIIDENLMIEYFYGIKEKYNIVNILDIPNYSRDIFSRISM